MFEEKLWSQELNITKYADIFGEHQTFIRKINNFSDKIVFSSGDFNSDNLDYMTTFDNVLASKKTISDYWKQFSDLITININDISSNSFIDEAINALNSSMENVWNETAISIQFEYLMNVRWMKILPFGVCCSYFQCSFFISIEIIKLQANGS